MKKVTRNNYILEVIEDKFFITDPMSVMNRINVELTDDHKVMYSFLYNSTLYTGDTPIDVFNQLVDKVSDFKLTEEYQNGFYDGVASVNKDLEDSYDKGYVQAMKDAVDAFNKIGKESVATLTNIGKKYGQKT